MTLIPENNTNVPDGWFDTSASSTYIDNGESELVVLGTWAAQCEMSQDNFCPIYGDYCLQNLYFCLVVDEPYNSKYQFTSVLGFGKPDGSYEQLMDSLVGEYWDQY